MEARILKEKGDRDVATIKELNLDNCNSTNVTGLSEDWKSLENLILTNAGLTSLKGFPKLPNLKKLELNKNNLSEGLDALACLPKLEELDLSGNSVKDLKTIQPLAKVNTLKSLILKGCGICKVENYKEKLFELIPSLVQLDGEKKKSKETQENGVAPKNGHEVHDIASSSDDDDLEELEDEDDSDLDEEESEDDAAEKDVPLKALYEIDDDVDDDDDFEAGEEEEDEEIDDEEEDVSVNISQNSVEETAGPRGTKRKHENEN